MNRDLFDKEIVHLRKECPLLDDIVVDDRGVRGLRNQETVVRIKSGLDRSTISRFRDAYMHAVAKNLIKPRGEQ